jgi:hypothetical protein
MLPVPPSLVKFTDAGVNVNVQVNSEIWFTAKGTEEPV